MTVRNCTSEEVRSFNIQLSRMSTLGYLVSKGAQLGVNEHGEYVLHDITHAPEAIWEPKHEDMLFNTKKKMKHLQLKEGEPVTLHCKPCSKNINGNDYAGGCITGTYRELGYYGGNHPVITLKIGDRELGILLEDVIDRV